MKYIAVTRFNDDTFNEYINFLKNNNLNKCERTKYSPDAPMIELWIDINELLHK